MTRPDTLCAAVKLMGQTRVSPEALKMGNDLLTYTETTTPSLLYPCLNPETLRLHVLVDFSGSYQTPQQNHQLGCIIRLSDDTFSFGAIH